MKKSAVLSAIFLLFLGFDLFPQDYSPVVLNSAHVRTIRSDIVKGMEYELCIALPSGYEKTAVKYPVVFMLDAYEIFGLQLQTYQQLAFFETVPPLILVGINYRFEGKPFYDGLKDYLYTRSRDFTPTVLSLEQIIEKHGKGFSEVVPVSGGGENFFRFLRVELFPFIESEYRADPDDRGILVYSLGGLFSTYALFADPKAFKRYFIGSPFLAWDDQAVFDFYKKSKFDGLKSPVKVYLSVGELEGKGMHHSWEKLKDFLEQTAHPNIQLQAEMLSGERHLTGIGAAHSRAFWRLYGSAPK
jgi:predicted alpha/beta superfamily hydrolase